MENNRERVLTEQAPDGSGVAVGSTFPEFAVASELIHARARAGATHELGPSAQHQLEESIGVFLALCSQFFNFIFAANNELT